MCRRNAAENHIARMSEHQEFVYSGKVGGTRYFRVSMRVRRHTGSKLVNGS
jgi:hypothetical protein